ncbi:3-oxoadipate enol-lactonase [Novosphingobium chloroacetimidivorans]|uniref:3-oxoadipate enol-lactonase n=1 Tax=Novosphingobium chloroacetimidivorans TaxID=1428314 RepID=A0A7W7K9D2_9SPHN|nr:alpha/beta fold hydrolase [Novosphingobium chloroacetimidivorans]MBB4858632.1 3-oxoadipate enol-lactonase [Novosphingobium chloroacetimidivorans]
MPDQQGRVFTVTADDDCQLSGRVCGEDDAEPLVLAHPIGFDHRFWEDAAAHLQKRFRLILPDARGHGTSSRGAGETSVEQLAADLLSILDGLDLPQAAFAGCSMGSATAMRLGAAAPERVTWLGLANAPAKIPLPRERFDAGIAASRSGGYPELARGMLSRWIAADIQESRPEWMEHTWAAMASTDGNGFADAFAALRDSDRTLDLTCLTAPALVITGEHDEAFAPQAATAMAESLADAQLAVIKGAGHLAPIEQPAAFAQVLIEFADGHARA